MQSPEIAARLAALRAKTLDGTITLEEYREVIALLRADRTQARRVTEAKSAAAAKPKKGKPKTQQVQLDLLKEIEMKEPT